MSDEVVGASAAEAALAAAAGVEGWLTDDQARRLWARAASADGLVVEIGSFRGRSTIVLASAAPQVVAIDPHAGGDRGPQEIAPDAARGASDHEAFLANLERAGVGNRVRHVRRPSNEAFEAVAGPVALLYIDGAHRFRSARADLAGWGARVAPGGAMLVHDAFSSVGVTLALLAECVFSARWRYAGRTGSLAEYERVEVRSRVRNVLRQLAELPWFARNLAIKLLIVARLRAGPWPY
jgi:Methyltransferase domain